MVWIYWSFNSYWNSPFIFPIRNKIIRSINTKCCIQYVVAAIVVALFYKLHKCINYYLCTIHHTTLWIQHFGALCFCWIDADFKSSSFFYLLSIRVGREKTLTDLPQKSESMLSRIYENDLEYLLQINCTNLIHSPQFCTALF